ncbi:MAG: DUF3027 domain-containing protein [Gordonia sp. (in: high G+C Gram-positive bacteria)]|uniref:DUF3027 domain-containing protein n=1 Tax=Gordonia sp. (in: high G+C Gram-positive bacteria) TaxID=84139 RepID=UPI0039E435EB
MEAQTDLTAEPSLLVQAEQIARDALVAEGEDPGAHLGSQAEGDWAVAHYFAAQVPGYVGWHWCVVLAGAPGSDVPTVSEVALLPGDDALLAPAWVPWSDRIAKGDLGPGDLLATPPDDPRLVPGHVDTLDVDPIDRDQVGQVFGEIGLGRDRLLSYEGRAEAAQRWNDGEYGPDSAMARGARHTCGSCGYYLPLAGALHGSFGVCANEFAADGHVVAAGHGCGAHADTPMPPGGAGSPAFDAYDDGAVEIVKIDAPVS